MSEFPVALYDAFTESAFGGSQAAIVTDAADIDQAERRSIARELGMPATAFVSACAESWIEAQFMSAVMELPMCGHGTLCLVTHLLESGRLDPNVSADIELRLPLGNARVTIEQREDGRYRVMLDVRPPVFEAPPPHIGELLGLLGLSAAALDTELEAETARGDFTHLILPLADLSAMRAITPNFGGMIEFCNNHGIETIAAFCREVENPQNTIHVRDFCPAVGVSESAAAGTTNAALASYLLRHRLLPYRDRVSVFAEQGIELGRPSSVQSIVSIRNREIDRLQVGGVASRVMSGRLQL